MRQLFAVAANTFLQTIRQPIYGLIVLLALGGFALLPSLTGWTLDDDNKMLRDMGLSTLLMQGLFLACFAASMALDTEIEEKTVLTATVKPVGRSVFVAGKYFGVLAALLAAHYLGTIAFFMTMRHGVLQTAAETSDLTVMAMGPGLMLLAAIAAVTLNYIWDWRFLPTMVSLALPGMTLGGIVLLVVDRDWKLQAYEITQTMDDLPKEISDQSVLKGIVTFRPLPGDQLLTGHRGHLVRRTWQGPISDADQQYLVDLSPSIRWKKDVNFLAVETRKHQGPELFKCTVLILVAIGVLGSVAVAASGRVGPIGTFLVCILILGAGLSSDQLLKPAADAGSAWAGFFYRVLPNFQFFWMLDALSDDRVIPWRYVYAAAGYGLTCAAAALALGIGLFQTREVG